MTIRSPLGNFIEVLKQVRETAFIHQSKLSKSEASTRSSLIDPILRALGWDTTNPAMLEFEKSFTNSRVDYALLSQNKKIEIIIEAKPLGGNLGDKNILLSLIMYALASGVKNIFLTDGMIWEHYTDYSPGNVVSSKTIDIARDDLLDCGIYMVKILDAAQFWKEEDLKVTPETESLSKQILDLRNEVSDLKNTIAQIQKPTISFEPSKLSVPQMAFIDLDKIHESVGENISNQEPPTALKFPDGTVKPISRWRDILIECAHYVLMNNSNIPLPLPDAAGKKVKLLDTQPPPKGITHHILDYNGKQIYIYTNYDSNHCVINGLYILKYLEPSKRIFQVSFTPVDHN